LPVDGFLLSLPVTAIEFLMGIHHTLIVLAPYFIWPFNLLHGLVYKL